MTSECGVSTTCVYSTHESYNYFFSCCKEVNPCCSCADCESYRAQHKNELEKELVERRAENDELQLTKRIERGARIIHTGLRTDQPKVIRALKIIWPILLVSLKLGLWILKIKMRSEGLWRSNPSAKHFAHDPEQQNQLIRKLYQEVQHLGDTLTTLQTSLDCMKKEMENNKEVTATKIAQMEETIGLLRASQAKKAKELEEVIQIAARLAR